MRALLVIVACAACACGRSALEAPDRAGPDTGAPPESVDGAATDATASSSSSGGGEDAPAAPDVAQPEETGARDEASAPGCPATMPSPGPCDTNGLMCTYDGGPCTCTSGCTMGCCPATCAQLGFPCAPAGDGCGGLLHCRECPAGDPCDTGGACLGPGDAGCAPVACPPTACGVIDDGCGGTIDCGECYWSCVLSGP